MNISIDSATSEALDTSPKTEIKLNFKWSDVNNLKDGSNVGADSSCIKKIESPKKQQEKKQMPKFFKISIVNNNGSLELDKLPRDGQLLKIPNNVNLSLDWNPKYKPYLYNEQ